MSCGGCRGAWRYLVKGYKTVCETANDVIISLGYVMICYVRLGEVPQEAP